VELAVLGCGDPVPVPLPRPLPTTPPKPCILFPSEDFVDRVADITSSQRAFVRRGLVQATVDALRFSLSLFVETLGRAGKPALRACRRRSGQMVVDWTFEQSLAIGKRCLARLFSISPSGRRD
jgi:hypothetical protein